MWYITITLLFLTLLYLFCDKLVQFIIRHFVLKFIKSATISFKSIQVIQLVPQIKIQIDTLSIRPNINSGSSNTPNSKKDATTDPRPLTFISWLPAVHVTVFNTNVYFLNQRTLGIAKLVLSSSYATGSNTRNAKISTKLKLEKITLIESSVLNTEIETIDIDVLLSPKSSLPLSITTSLAVVKCKIVYSKFTSNINFKGVIVQVQCSPLSTAARSVVLSGGIEVQPFRCYLGATLDDNAGIVRDADSIKLKRQVMLSTESTKVSLNDVEYLVRSWKVKAGKGLVRATLGTTVLSVAGCIQLVQEPIILKGSPYQDFDITTGGTCIVNNYKNNNSKKWVQCGSVDVVYTRKQNVSDENSCKGAININNLVVSVELGTIIHFIEIMDEFILLMPLMKSKGTTATELSNSNIVDPNRQEIRVWNVTLFDSCINWQVTRRESIQIKNNVLRGTSGDIMGTRHFERCPWVDFDDITVTLFQSNTEKLPKEYQLALIPRISLTMPIGAPTINDEESASIAAVPTLTFSSKTIITMENDMKFGVLLTSILNQIGVLKGIIKQKNLGSRPATKSTFKKMCVNISELIFSIGKTDDLWVYASELEIHLFMNKNRQELLNDVMKQVDPTGFNSAVKHGFATVMGCRLVLKTGHLRVALGQDRHPIDLVSSKNLHVEGDVLLSELNKVSDFISSINVELPTTLFNKSCANFQETTGCDVGLQYILRSIERTGMPMKIFYNLSIDSDVLSIGHGVCLNEDLILLDQALQHFLPPSTSKWKKLTWWDNLRYMAHGALQVQSSKLLVTLFGPSGTSKMDGKHIFVHCSDANVIINTGSIDVHLKNIELTTGKINSIEEKNISLVDIDVLKVSIKWSWKCLEESDPNNHHAQLHSNRKDDDLFSHFRSHSLDLAVYFKTYDTNNKEMGTAKKIFVRIPWNHISWFRSFVQMYVVTPPNFQMYHGPPKPSISHPMEHLIVQVETAALTIVWCNDEQKESKEILATTIGAACTIEMTKKPSSFDPFVVTPITCLTSTSELYLHSSCRKIYNNGCSTRRKSSDSSDIRGSPLLIAKSTVPLAMQEKYNILVASASCIEVGMGGGAMNGMKWCTNHCIGLSSSHEVLDFEHDTVRFYNACVIFDVMRRDVVTSIIESIWTDEKDGGSGDSGDSDDSDGRGGKTDSSMYKTNQQCSTRKSAKLDPSVDLLKLLVERADKDGTNFVRSASPTNVLPISPTCTMSTNSARYRSHSISSTNSSDRGSRRSSTDFLGESRTKLLTSFELSFLKPQVQFRSNDRIVVLTMNEAHVNFEENEQMEQDGAHSSSSSVETERSGMRAVCTNVIGYVTDGNSWIQENTTEHVCLRAPSLIISRSNGYAPTLSLNLPVLRATTNFREYNDIVAIIVKVILAPPLVEEVSKVENVLGCTNNKPATIAGVVELGDGEREGQGGNDGEEMSEIKQQEQVLLKEQDISNAASQIHSERNGHLIQTINYHVREFVWNILPPSSNGSIQVDMFKLIGRHDYYSVREYSTSEIDICDLSIQNLKPTEIEMMSFEDPMSILEAVVEDRSQNTGKNRVKFLSLVTACRTVQVNDNTFTMYDRFEVNVFPGAAGLIQLQITSQIADSLSAFFAMSEAVEESSEQDASNLLFGSGSGMLSKTSIIDAGGDDDEDNVMTQNSGENDCSTEVFTTQEKMYVQKMRLSEVTFVLCARDFTVAIPDKWRVRIKALQLNSIVTDWGKLGNSIIMHFVKKIAKSLVLKNGAKTIVGSLTGKAFKAHGSAATFYTAETEEESATLLFGSK